MNSSINNKNAKIEVGKDAIYFSFVGYELEKVQDKMEILTKAFKGYKYDENLILDLGYAIMGYLCKEGRIKW